MKHFNANGMVMSQILGFSKPREERGQVLSNGQMPDQVRHDVLVGEEVQVKADLSIPAQVNTSFVPYITSVGKQCLQPMAYGIKLMTLLFFVFHPFVCFQRMMKNKAIRICVYGFVSLLFNNAALAQSRGTLGAVDGEVSIGHSVPEGFWTREHLFFINGDTVRNTLEQHKGKMIVLDFWFSGCAPCLLHQKDIKDFVYEYPDDLVVIMVNSRNAREGYQKIADLHADRYFSRFGMESLTSIIEDDYLQNLFPYTSFPHYVWINRDGRLQLRTFRNLLDRAYVAPFIDKDND